MTTVKDRLVLKIYPFFRGRVAFRTFPALARGCQAGYRIYPAPRFKLRVFPFFDYLAIRAPIPCHEVFRPSLAPPHTFLTILARLAGHQLLGERSDLASLCCRAHGKEISCC
jgi:hypothetical protein